MSNPTYKGAGQLVNGNGGGLLRRLGSVFGGAGTPAYRGDGQPSPGAGGFFGAVTPRYKDSSKALATGEGLTDAVSQSEPTIIPIDRDELAAGKIAVIDLAPGKIAIVVPRDVCAPDPSALDSVEAAIAQQQQQQS